MLSKYYVFGIRLKNENVMLYKEYARPHTLQELKRLNASGIRAADPEYIAAYKDLATFKENESGSIQIKYKRIRRTISGAVWD